MAGREVHDSEAGPALPSSKSRKRKKLQLKQSSLPPSWTAQSRPLCSAALCEGKHSRDISSCAACDVAMCQACTEHHKESEFGSHYDVTLLNESITAEKVGNKEDVEPEPFDEEEGRHRKSIRAENESSESFTTSEDDTYLQQVRPQPCMRSLRPAQYSRSTAALPRRCRRASWLRWA